MFAEINKAAFAQEQAAAQKEIDDRNNAGPTGWLAIDAPLREAIESFATDIARQGCPKAVAIVLAQKIVTLEWEVKALRREAEKIPAHLQQVERRAR